MSHRHRLSDEMRWRAIGRLEAGQSQTEVASWLRVSRMVVNRLWRQFQNTGSVRRRHVPGRPRSTSVPDDRYLALTARRNRSMTSRQLASELTAATGRSVSRWTVSRRLRESGLYARRPVVCVPLTSSHRRERLRWAQEHLHWTREQWSNVLFTDESRFSLQTDSRRVFIWRERGMRYHPSNTTERDTYGGGGCMVWAGIMRNGRTDLHLFSRGSINAIRYRDEIVAPYVRLFAAAVGPEFVLMQDNARIHTARLVLDYLESEGVAFMEWPARSPDLNPIEHLWDALGRRVAALRPPPRNVQELRSALVQQYDRLPSELIDSLVDSMPRRCQSCVTMRGDHTPY